MRNCVFIKVILINVTWTCFLISKCRVNSCLDGECLNYGDACRCSGRSPRLKDCKYMETIETLHLINCDLLPETSEDFSDFTNLAVLNIYNCSFSQLDVVDLFREIISLEEMKVNYSNISEGILFVVAANKELVEVRLGHNKIRKVCGTIFSQLPYLSMVDLSDNMIKEIINSDKNCKGDKFSEPFSDLPELQHILLRNNVIERLGRRSFGSMPKLLTLDLSHNTISEIEPLTFNIRDEEEVIVRENVLLNISFNTLSVLRDRTFAGCDSVTTLDLSHNRVRSIEIEALTELASLQHLNLSSNRLRALQHVYRPLKALQELNLRRNELTSVPADVFRDLQLLSSLDLSRNRITRCDQHSFRGLDSLRTLLLQENELQELGETFIESRPHLLVLRMAGNSVREIRRRAFAGCGALQELDLSRNEVTLVENYAFQNNVALQVLDLSGNALRWLPCHAFFGLRELRALRLGTGNRLRSFLHVHVAPLHALRTLSLRLPTDSLCECAAFRQLQVQQVFLELDPGAQEEDCFVYFKKLKDGEGFGDDCVHFNPQPDCSYNKTEYVQWRSSGNREREPPEVLPATRAVSTASLERFKANTPHHRDSSSQMSFSSQPPHSASSDRESDPPIKYSTRSKTSFPPSTTTSSILSPVANSTHVRTTQHFKHLNVSDNFTLISSPQNTTDETQIDLDLPAVQTTTSEIRAPEEDWTVSTTQLIFVSSSSPVKKKLLSTSMSPGLETVFVSLMSILLLLSGAVISVFAYKFCLRCRFKLLEWSHEYETVHIDGSRERSRVRDQPTVDDGSSLYDSVDERDALSAV